MAARRQLGRIRRLVVKVGTSLITEPNTGPDPDRIAALATEIAGARDGREVVLVSSGAIATGMARLALPARPRSIPEKQAAAAVGQSALMWHYEAAFKRHAIAVGQVLLTAQDIGDRARYLNARNTLLALLRFGVLPIVNENDTVAVEEIKVGDNDNLSALVASLIDADLLVLLTDVEGLYTGDPATDPGARVIDTVESVTDDVTRPVYNGTGAGAVGGGEVVAGVGDGRDFARGLVSLGGGELRRIRGAKTRDIAARLGYKSFDKVIHRDNLVIL